MSDEPVWLIYSCGYPFSGKSTLSRTISVTTGFALVEVDSYMDPSATWRDAYVAAYRDVRTQLAAGRSVVLDSVAHTRKNRYRLGRLAREHGAEVLPIWLDVSVGEADRRRRANLANPSRPQVPDEGFDWIVSEFEPPGAEESVLIYRPEMEITAWIAAEVLPHLGKRAVLS